MIELMLYLYSDKNQIKLLFQKKTMLGQYESAFYKKIHQLNLTENGQIANMDFFASALREALTVVSPAAVKEKEINLILPQEAFGFMRAEVPSDVANSAITAFIRDKARAHLSLDLDNSLYDFTIQENEKGKQILFYAISKDIVQKYQEALGLINLQLVNIIPEPLAYFKLFEKTLRKDKKEYIMYISYENAEVKGYMYDSYGPLEESRIEHKIAANSSLESYLKKIAEECEKQGKKLNRLILSGQDSETIRQDTFTKDVGVWTNPLKRIIPQFYEDYLKILVTSPNTTLPFLLYDITIGAFIFSLENKQFSMFKKGSMKVPSSSGNRSGKKMRIPMKELLLFVASFGLSFLLLLSVMKFTGSDSNFLKSSKNEVTPTKTVSPISEEPTPTPAPELERKDINVKILNGTGTAGQAAEVKDILLKLGYVDILTGNADNFDYKTSEIQVKKGEDALSNLMKTDLKSHTTSPKISTLDEDSAADVVIIFGADFE
ncbi:MAG: LytR C-terminal domain-containing protein [Patescibacteria group bacterium]